MLQFVRDNALWFVLGWPIVALVCGLIVARILRHNEQSYPTVYDQEDSAERAAQPPDRDPNTVLSTRRAEAWGRPRRSLDADQPDGFQGSEAHVTGHGAHYDRWGG